MLLVRKSSLWKRDPRHWLSEAGRRRAKSISAEEYLGKVVSFLDEFEAIRRRWQ
jgi:hypothetical protein